MFLKPFTDKHGNILSVGNKLRTSQYDNSKAEIEVVSIDNEKVTFRWLDMRGSDFPLSQISFAESCWVVCKN